MIKKKTKKTKKKSSVKRKQVIKRKPIEEIVLPVEKAPLITKEVVVEKPAKVFYGTVYEKKIMDVCTENEFPFDYRRAKIDEEVVDFINRSKRLIIEVYNPERNWKEVQARLRLFLVQRFKTKYITKDKLSMRGWKKSLIASIKRFLE